jgi:hypothetical protein
MPGMCFFLANSALKDMRRMPRLVEPYRRVSIREYRKGAAGLTVDTARDGLADTFLLRQCEQHTRSVPRNVLHVVLLLSPLISLALQRRGRIPWRKTTLHAETLPRLFLR